jgi:dihydrofolate reductase
MILALAANGALGLAGKLPWSLPEDREHFERTTQGHVVIMGRRTWEEEGRPLPGRVSIVVSRSFVASPTDAGVVHAARSLDEALALAYRLDDAPGPFVIGGAQLFADALPRVTRIYLTEIATAPEADVFFELDRTGFTATSERAGAAGVRYLVLERA